jgi:hypothetical protein
LRRIARASFGSVPSVAIAGFTESWGGYAAAQEKHGLKRFNQIKHAVAETTGGISILPNKGAGT